MKNYIILIIVFFVSCKNEKETPKEIEIIPKEIVNDPIPYIKFTPDTLSGVKIEGFEISAAFKLGDKKIITGYYDAVGGKLSHHDSDTNYGQRLLVQNDKNEIIYTSKGAMDAFLFQPHFYKNNQNKKIIIVFQLAFEYFYGGDVFLIDAAAIKDIGTLDVASMKEEESLIDILKIKEFGKQIDFSFTSDSLLLEPGSKDLPVKNDSVRYVFKDGSLKFYK